MTLTKSEGITKRLSLLGNIKQGWKGIAHEVQTTRFESQMQSELMVKAKKLIVTHNGLYFSKSVKYPCPVSSISQFTLRFNKVVSGFKLTSPPTWSLAYYLDRFSPIFIF